jgi:hypothetical protein
MLKFFVSDPESGAFMTMDPWNGMEKSGSGINIPVSATLVGTRYRVFYKDAEKADRNLKLEPNQKFPFNTQNFVKMLVLKIFCQKFTFSRFMHKLVYE